MKDAKEKRKNNVKKVEKSIMKKQSAKAETKKNRGRSTSRAVLWLVVIAAIVITIVFVCANVFFIIPNLSKNLSEDIFIVELLSAALSIIGLAVSVWAGLNIVNAIERKEIEKIAEKHKEIAEEGNKRLEDVLKSAQKRLQRVQKRLESVYEKQIKADKEKMLNEMYITANDLSTRVLIERFKGIQRSDTYDDIDYLSLIEIERLFNSVYHLHKSEFSYDKDLLDDADKGIKAARHIKNSLNIDPTIRLYLEYRIAEFNFYIGYCCEKSERKKYLDEAINIYFNIYEAFGAQLPIYDPEFEYCPDIKLKECSESKSSISAYFCNSIGEAYSKIIEAKDHTFFACDEEKEYSKKAVFYCAYASQWGGRETYWRNLGCAIERQYNMSGEPFDILKDIYQRAFNIEATIKSFKVLLSICDKQFNSKMKIRGVDIKVGRETPLNDASYEQTWNQLDKSMQDNLLEILSFNQKLCEYAKTIYPAKDVGYMYTCLYHRDMCIINFNSPDMARNHYMLAKQELNILQIINPKSPITKIIDADLQALSRKYGQTRFA